MLLKLRKHKWATRIALKYGRPGIDTLAFYFWFGRDVTGQYSTSRPCPRQYPWCAPDLIPYRGVHQYSCFKANHDRRDPTMHSYVIRNIHVAEMRRHGRQLSGTSLDCFYQTSEDDCIDMLGVATLSENHCFSTRRMEKDRTFMISGLRQVLVPVHTICKTC